MVGGAQYNGKRAIVESPISTSVGQAAGRKKTQLVYVIEDNKAITVKPINLRHEPREVSSLSVEETKRILRGPSCIIEKMKNTYSIGDGGKMVGFIGSLVAAIMVSDTSLMEIERADERECDDNDDGLAPRLFR